MSEYFERSVLSNGITVLTDPMPDVRSITLGVWFRVGSRDETSELSGMSHFMEHMFFKGTEKRSAIDISIDFDSLGAESNAFTSKECTCYYARFVDEQLEPVTEILADMLLNSQFDPEAIASESKVVIEEIARSEDDPDDVVFDIYSDATYPFDPIGRPVLGSRETVSSFTHDDFVAYHDAHYTAENCCIAACGNVDHDKLVEICERLFSDMPRGARKERGFQYGTPRGFSGLKKDTEQAHVIYGYKGISSDDPDRYAFALLLSALGGGMSSRLFQEVREKRGLVYSIFAAPTSFEGAGDSVICAGTRPENLAELSQVVKSEVEKVVSEGITQEELERVCNYTVSQLLLSTESTRNRMVKLGRYEVTNYPHASVEESVEHYRSVTLEDVNRVAKRLLDVEPVIAVVSPLEPGEALETIKKGFEA